jgi:hypothetical protein
MRSVILIRGSIALVWTAAQSRTALLSLGLFEVLLAVWVISGRLALQAALVQTALLLLMNGGGVIWARRIIPDAAGMLFQNLAFAMLAWVAAGVL